MAYWAVQAGLLTHLTFAGHRLIPLAAFTSGGMESGLETVPWDSLHNGRR